LKREEFFNRQKALRVLFAQYLYAAKAADGGYYVTEQLQPLLQCSLMLTATVLPQ
jgi:hypothetical protein